MPCHLCGCTTVMNYKQFQTHMKDFHAVTHNARPKYRPKAEVVADWESRNGQYLIDGTKEHKEETCQTEQCDVCFTSRLDRLLASTEEGISNVSGTGVAFNDAMAGDKL